MAIDNAPLSIQYFCKSRPGVCFIDYFEEKARRPFSLVGKDCDSKDNWNAMSCKKLCLRPQSPEYLKTARPEHGNTAHPDANITTQMNMFIPTLEYVIAEIAEHENITMSKHLSTTTPERVNTPPTGHFNATTPLAANKDDLLAVVMSNANMRLKSDGIAITYGLNSDITIEKASDNNDKQEKDQVIEKNIENEIHPNIGVFNIYEENDSFKEEGDGSCDEIYAEMIDTDTPPELDDIANIQLPKSPKILYINCDDTVDSLIDPELAPYVDHSSDFERDTNNNTNLQVPHSISDLQVLNNIPDPQISNNYSDTQASNNCANSSASDTNENRERVTGGQEDGIESNDSEDCERNHASEDDKTKDSNNKEDDHGGENEHTNQNNEDSKSNGESDDSDKDSDKDKDKDDDDDDDDEDSDDDEDESNEYNITDDEDDDATEDDLDGMIGHRNTFGGLFLNDEEGYEEFVNAVESEMQQENEEEAHDSNNDGNGTDESDSDEEESSDDSSDSDNVTNDATDNADNDSDSTPDEEQEEDGEENEAAVSDGDNDAGNPNRILLGVAATIQPETEDDLVASGSGEASGSGVASGSRVAKTDGEEVFDVELPTRHSYLGPNMKESTGCTIYDENTVKILPLLLQNNGLVSVPGQTLPLNLYHSPTINMIERIVKKDRTFGIVACSQIENSDSDTNPHPLVGAVGVTVEIYQHSELVGMDLGYCIKARCRQRFRVIEILSAQETYSRFGWQTVTGKVLILPEVKLTPLFNIYSTPAIDRVRNTRAKRRWQAAMSPFPVFLLEQYYEPLIVRQLKSGLEEMCSLPTRSRVCSIGPVRDRISQQEDLFDQFFPHHKRAAPQRVQPPTGALELSFWIANSLPLVDTQRVLLLKIHSSLQRLRWELSFLSQCRWMCCVVCGMQVANCEDTFCMSAEGPLGTYVNPHGFVHDAITVTATSNISLYGEPCLEHTWFPGYAWTVMHCGNCNAHVGWKFECSRLVPSEFFGLTRSAIVTLTFNKSGQICSSPIERRPIL